jgi:hypothetical protein
MLIAVVAVIMLTYYFILRDDQELQQDVVEICTDYISKSKDIPDNLRNNALYQKCVKLAKKQVKKEDFGYGFGLYGNVPYDSGYQRSEWIEGLSPYPRLSYPCCK